METWQKCLDKNGVNGTLLTVLYKVFHCLLYNFLIAKHAANVLIQIIIFNTNLSFQ